MGSQCFEILATFKAAYAILLNMNTQSFSDRILYIDNHLLVVNKPSDCLTQPSPICNDSLETWAKDWLKETMKKPGNVFLEAVHRLDRPVSGVVLFARTSKALSRLHASSRQKEFRKIYYAVVEGIPARLSGRLVHQLRHDRMHARLSEVTDKRSKEAVLEYEVVSSNGGNSLLKIELVTGRYHQIRAQLSAIGNPVAGDEKYGARPLSHKSIALHHRSLTFIHPVRKVEQTVVAPVPDLPVWRKFQVQK